MNNLKNLIIGKIQQARLDLIMEKDVTKITPAADVADSILEIVRNNMSEVVTPEMVKMITPADRITRAMDDLLSIILENPEMPLIPQLRISEVIDDLERMVGQPWAKKAS